MSGKYKILKGLFRRFTLILTCVYLPQAFAFGRPPSGAGSLADDLMGPVGLISNFVQAGCLILGTSFIFASVVKYFEHRRNPLMVNISTVVFLLIAGILMLCIPIFNYFFAAGYGIDV